MGKKCIICGIEARFVIKGSSEYYCNDCAHENFSDIELLQNIEEQAKIIKEWIKEKTDEKEIEQFDEDIESIDNKIDN
jgi:hypothetical protein